MRLKRDFYERNTLTVAKELLGKTLVVLVDNVPVKSKIVETEAYIGPHDKAAHTYNNRRTMRTETMVLTGGHAYVYQIYGMYFCLNVTTSLKEKPEAVLIRAVEPIEHIEILKKHRKIKIKRERDLTNGPGKLCQALKIDKRIDGVDFVTNDGYYIEDEKSSLEAIEIISAKRIGIDYAEEYKDKAWRFYIKDNVYVSKK
ncbi:DNA-3-methyladenine glycosylase [Haloplasma contractile]|uniref:Putative 3-methyladenine DNA glycosylase n=1 Tax=Haloplasma contractile SSD-17B TaxID=1033810 RepID=U2FLH2_9MOLU|nr:DNA-3-methyladenine glycosylase [Haloplasma contractile]ERJ13595.1 DNA-3-methyladenine glycosylase protein [Haloplasma contractile SSD-17B]